MNGLYLCAGHLKYISIDREAAARGAPAWVVRVEVLRDHKLLGVFHGSRLAIYATEDDGTIDCKGSKAQPLTPSGPAFWIETTAAVEVFE